MIAGLKPWRPAVRKGHPLAAKLASAVPLHEGGGSVVYDVAYGPGMNGTLSGATTPTWSPQGPSGRCLSFGGSPAQVIFYPQGSTGNAGPAWQQTGRFSVAVWIRPGLINGTDQVAISCAGQSGVQFTGWLLRVASSPANSAQFLVGNGAGTNGLASSAVTLAVGKWYLLCATFDGSNLRLYTIDSQNNVDVATTAYSSAISYTNVYARLGVVCQSTASALIQYYTGLIDAPLVFADALSRSQVMALRDDYFAPLRQPSRTAALAAGLGIATGSGGGSSGPPRFFPEALGFSPLSGIR